MPSVSSRSTASTSSSAATTCRSSPARAVRPHPAGPGPRRRPSAGRRVLGARGLARASVHVAAARLPDAPSPLGRLGRHAPGRARAPRPRRRRPRGGRAPGSPDQPRRRGGARARPAPRARRVGQVVRERRLDAAAGEGSPARDPPRTAATRSGARARPGDAAPGVRAGSAHPEVEQRPRGRRHERGLVRPVLDDPPRGVVAGPSSRVVVRPEPGEERQVVAADDDVDAVDLDDTDGIDHPLQVARPRHDRPGTREPCAASATRRAAPRLRCTPGGA